MATKKRYIPSEEYRQMLVRDGDRVLKNGMTNS